jgi:PAS domain S-box-containing protein
MKTYNGITNEQTDIMPVLLDQVLNPVLIIDIKKGTILNASKSATNLLGYSLDEIKQLKVGNIQVGVPIKDQKDWDAHVKRIQFSPDNITSIKGALQKKNGDIIPSLSHLKIQPYLESDVLVVEIEDLSDRLLKETEMKDLQKRFKTALEHTFVGFAICDSNGKILDVNNPFCKTMGYSKKELLNLTWMSLTHPEDLMIGESLYKQLINQEIENFRVEKRYICKDGSIIWGVVSVASVKDERGTLIYTIGQLLDITQRKLSEIKLKEANKKLEKLSEQLLTIQDKERKHIAQELHDNLGQVFSLQRIQLSNIKNITTEPFITNQIDSILKTTDTAIASIRKVAKNIFPSGLDSMGLAEAIKIKVIDINTYANFKITLNLYTTRHMISSLTRTNLYRIFQESVTNIIRHSLAKHVALELKEEGRYLVLIIKDDGVGASEQQLKTDNSFGIDNMRRRAEIINGTLTVHSIKNKGTTIMVKVPLQ